MDDDIIIACCELAGRCGATGFDIGYLLDNVPTEEAKWWAEVQWRGTRIITDNHRSPTGAALALAERLLTGSACKCGDTVTLSDLQPGCRWALNGKRWEPGCDSPPIRVKGERGDTSAIKAAMAEHLGQPGRTGPGRHRRDP